MARKKTYRTYRNPASRARQRRKGESIEAFAKRRFETQRRYFEKIHSGPLLRWENLDFETRVHWIRTSIQLDENNTKAKEK